MKYDLVLWAAILAVFAIFFATLLIKFPPYLCDLQRDWAELGRDSLLSLSWHRAG